MYFTAAADLDLLRGPQALGLPYAADWEFGVTLDQLTADLLGRDVSEFGDHVKVACDKQFAVWRAPAATVAGLAAITDERLAEYCEEELLSQEEIAGTRDLRDVAAAAVATGKNLYRWSFA